MENNIKYYNNSIIEKYKNILKIKKKTNDHIMTVLEISRFGVKIWNENISWREFEEEWEALF